MNRPIVMSWGEALGPNDLVELANVGMPSSRDQREPVGGADQLLVHEFLDSKIGEFLAIAGPLDSAERQVRRADGRVVDEDHACFDSARHLLAVLDVLGVNGTAEPKR